MNVDNAYFDALYRSAADPWSVADSWYEQRKQALLLAALPRARYRCGFEPACGVGVLTAELALRCDRLFASDFSAVALAHTRERLQDSPDAGTRVELHVAIAPDDWRIFPDEQFDLIVCSEFLYYLQADAQARLRERCVQLLAPNGHLAMCHWRHPMNDRLCETSDIHAAFGREPGLQHEVRIEDNDFLLDVWSKNVVLRQKFIEEIV